MKFVPANPLVAARMPAAGANRHNPLEGRIDQIGHLQFAQVRRTPEERLFNSLLEQYHYLKYQQPVGEHAKYLVGHRDVPSHAWPGVRRRGTWAVATVISDGAPRRVGAISTSSHITPAFSLCLGSVSKIWPPTFSAAWPCESPKTGSRCTGIDLLLETFVDPERFRGTCYRAANWVLLGKTTGRGKQSNSYVPNRSTKEKRFRELLGRVA